MGVTKRTPNTACFPSRIHRQRRTCEQCAKAKRKCDKTVPSCLRCFERGIRCTYPPRPNSFISFGGSEPAFEAIDLGEEEGENNRAAIGTSLTRVQPSSLPASAGASHAPCAGADASTSCRWFLSPESWTRQYGPSAPPGQPEAPVSQVSHPAFITKLQDWAAVWIRDGRSPMMHAQLYQHGMPECVEDAYTSLAAYNAASPSAKPAALRVIQNRVDKLLAQTRAADSVDVDVDGISSACLLDTPTHLARTQALFVYQLIRLFDGDIRARAQAEGDAETLRTWCRQMLESAQLDCAAAELCSHSLMATPPNPSSHTDTITSVADLEDHPLHAHIPNTVTDNSTTTNPLSLPTLPNQTPPPDLLWRAWTLSESLRRTYLAATFMQSVYDAFRQGWAACPGGLAFTAQRGLWEAASGYEWAAACALGPWAMAQSLESWRILERGAPAEVDEFAVAVLEISFGVESVERWRFERGDG